MLGVHNGYMTTPATMSTLFLGMALVAALHSFRQTNLSLLDWTVFAYFVFNRFRYFSGSIPWDRAAARCYHSNRGWQRSLAIPLSLTNLFLSVVIAVHINQLLSYLLLSAANLLVATCYLLLERLVFIDPAKDNGEVKLLDIQTDWIRFNLIEMVIFLTAAFVYFADSDIKAILPTLAKAPLVDWTFAVSFLLLFFLMILDWLMHHAFLFADYTSE